MAFWLCSKCVKVWSSNKTFFFSNRYFSNQTVRWCCVHVCLGRSIDLYENTAIIYGCNIELGRSNEFFLFINAQGVELYHDAVHADVWTPMARGHGRYGVPGTVGTPNAWNMVSYHCSYIMNTRSLVDNVQVFKNKTLVYENSALYLII